MSCNWTIQVLSLHNGKAYYTLSKTSCWFRQRSGRNRMSIYHQYRSILITCQNTRVLGLCMCAWICNPRNRCYF